MKLGHNWFTVYQLSKTIIVHWDLCVQEQQVQVWPGLQFGVIGQYHYVCDCVLVYDFSELFRPMNTMVTLNCLLALACAVITKALLLWYNFLQMMQYLNNIL